MPLFDKRRWLAMSRRVQNLFAPTSGGSMDDLSPSDLKAILHSKRANLHYVEHCRVLVNGGASST